MKAAMLGLRVSNSRFLFRASFLRIRVSGFRFRVSVFGFRVSGFGFPSARIVLGGFGFCLSVSDFGVSGLGNRVSSTPFEEGHEAPCVEQRHITRHKHLIYGPGFELRVHGSVSICSGVSGGVGNNIGKHPLSCHIDSDRAPPPPLPAIPPARV